MNEQTLNYCKKFIESPESPHFALFIKGKWGSGKTYFIDKLIEHYPSQSATSKQKIFSNRRQKTDNTSYTITRDQILKISLYGITSNDEISSKLFQAAFPFFRSKLAKILIPSVKTLSKLIPKVDLTELNIPLQDLFSINKKVLIVDDIERTGIPINQIFGYFSQLISDSDTRVIFIGNEEKLEDNPSIIKNILSLKSKDNSKEKEYIIHTFNEKIIETYLKEHDSILDESIKKQIQKEIGANRDYLSIKEKTIGMEFFIYPDKQNAINAFIDELNFDSVTSFINEKINEVVEKLNCDNLRTVRQCLYNLKLFISVFPKQILKKDKELSMLYFMILFIQKSLNFITPETPIHFILTAFFNYNKSYLLYEEDKKQKSNSETYNDFSTFSGKIPFLNCWKEIIFNGTYDANLLNEEYKNEQKALKVKKQKNNSLVEIINNWRNLSKENFEKLAKQLKNEISEGYYLNPGEILLYANYFIIFSKWGLIPDSIDEIKQQLDEVIDIYKDKIIPIKDWGMISMGYGSYGFSIDIQEFNEIREKFHQLNIELLQSKSKTTFDNDIETMDLGSDEFIANIIHVNGNNKYYGQPILSFINIEDFYNQLEKLSVEKQSRIISAFEERYGLSYANHPFHKEYEPDFRNLEKLYNLYKKNEKKINYDPQELLKREITKRLKELCDYFRENIHS